MFFYQKSLFSMKIIIDVHSTQLQIKISRLNRLMSVIKRIRNENDHYEKKKSHS